MTSLVATAIGIEGRLQPTNLDVASAAMVALVGPNGGGKTSLLRAVARVERASGSVLIDGEDVDAANEARRRSLQAFVPASRDVAWPITARDVVALGLGVRDNARISELIDQFELADLANRPINRLSTGERARVLLARALAARPKALLLDEPFANLEPYWVLRFTELLRTIRDEGAIILVALHDLAQLASFDQALVIAEGAVQMDEAPAELILDERFQSLFRITPDGERWRIRPPADPQSSR